MTGIALRQCVDDPKIAADAGPGKDTPHDNPTARRYLSIMNRHLLSIPRSSRHHGRILPGKFQDFW
ncbi:hypothetical protein [Rhizobium sp. 9140]|uniref:hypothetical protein n=1 Tax=Rhizobium sp. 9140 TaxID=1761900 RepID=UPI000AA3CF9B|nr:hypothetical protein [Rhizobium sp. 9140]